MKPTELRLIPLPLESQIHRTISPEVKVGIVPYQHAFQRNTEVCAELSPELPERRYSHGFKHFLKNHYRKLSYCVSLG